MKENKIDMKIHFTYLVGFIFFLLQISNIAANNNNPSCSDYINSLGFPVNPKTVIDFEYLNLAIGELKEINKDCLPNTTDSSTLNFESLFSEKIIENLIITYTTDQVRQLALIDFKSAISGISYWYHTSNDQFALEKARLYLLKCYSMIRSLEIYDKNPANKNASSEQVEFVKSVVFNEIKIIESYIGFNKFFGALNDRENLYVKSEIARYIKRLKLITLLLNDKEYHLRLDTVLEGLK